MMNEENFAIETITSFFPMVGKERIPPQLVRLVVKGDSRTVVTSYCADSQIKEKVTVFSVKARAYFEGERRGMPFPKLK